MNKDLSLFFQVGDPGIIEATHTDLDYNEASIVAELIDTTQAHKRGEQHINHDGVVLKLPEDWAKDVDIDHSVTVSGVVYEVTEKVTIATGICALYLVDKPEPGDHRWG